MWWWYWPAFATTTPVWRAEGSGPMLFLAPGGGGVPFPSTYPDVLTDDFLVVTYDPCGVRANAPCPLRDTLREMEEDAATVLAAARAEYTPDRVFLGGFSGGAFIAANLASTTMRDDAALAGLVLISPVGDFPEARRQQDAIFSRWWPVLARLPLPDYPTYVLRQLLLGVHCVQPSADAWSRLGCRTPLQIAPSSLTEGRRAFEQRTRIRDAYLQQVLHANVTCPVHMLVGLHDRIAPLSLAERALREQIDAPRTELHVFQFSAHHVRYEEPERFARIMREMR